MTRSNDPIEFQAKVANFIGVGIDWETIGGKNYKNTIKLKLGKYRAIIRQETLVFSNNIKSGDIYYTTNISLKGIKNFKQGENIVNDICSLLSLASTSQVVPFEYKHGSNGKVIGVHRHTIRSLPLIEIHDGESIKNFLESTWRNYRKLKIKRKLPEVIDMITYAELPIQPLEIKLAQVFIIFENLKATNADFHNIPFDRGYYRKISNPPKNNLSSEPKYSFEELMLLMFADVGMTPKLKRVKTLRNQIIHFGLSKRSYNSLQKHYEFCQDLIREYFLHLLNFNGSFLIYSERNTARKIIQS